MDAAAGHRPAKTPKDKNRTRRIAGRVLMLLGVAAVAADRKSTRLNSSH